LVRRSWTPWHKVFQIRVEGRQTRDAQEEAWHIEERRKAIAIGLSEARKKGKKVPKKKAS
jgi:Family of unknown function (DUF6496)